MRTLVVIADLSITFKANREAVVITAHEKTGNNRSWELCDERFAANVLPYTAKFNADYCIDNMPEDVYEYIDDMQQLRYFKNWLTTQYEIAIRNYALGGLEDGKEDN